MQDDPTVFILLYFIMPLWFLAGIADWLCHKASDIEHTAGAKESVIHLLMFSELAVPLLAALFLEINALVIATMIVAFFLHEATALWDVSYAVKHRYVSPLEQHVHSFLEMVPLMAMVLVISRHWGQFQALFGFGEEQARFDITLKSEPMPVLYIVALLAAALLLEFLPYVQELWRGLRANRGRLVPAKKRPAAPR